MKILITGGAGFIGCNSAKRLMEKGEEVIIFDNLSRKGTPENLKWVKENGKIKFYQGDIKNYREMEKVFSENKDIDVVLHLAAQVAVTTSIVDPREDFDTNAVGALNVLEAIRNFSPQTKLIFASTNKVYGEMKDIKIIEKDERYTYKDFPEGIPETRLLDFHSPYGCSKGTADQYVIDYSKTYGLRTLVFRQSCIYGYRQFGVEDQGWVAWFTIAAVLGKQITIYGDGKQVRDVLFIDDLIDCYIKGIENIDRISGRVYNIGGGPNNKISLLELINILEKLTSKEIVCNFADWRQGDQLVFICDIKRAKMDFGWTPRLSPQEGVEKLYEWVVGDRKILEKYS